ncbi:glycoside hydrolase family 2 protein [Mucilaginibacter terrenus]|uniref:Glycoside hydrolase family 2 protein n=1 Tax=Mucilaginibacter terrenus TaxID=2482727 RepID=A0A3E2NY86_9SPHI|nr:beta-galactosidase GalB [Mucilaginibacter terrenus]RFZ85974.1 glycoside hydrolase family 2 protein [Mucilaginibacter terrenus]
MKSFLTTRIAGVLTLALSLIMVQSFAQSARTIADFDKGWKFHLGDVKNADKASANDKNWRNLSLPHDWSIEGTFSKDNPASPEGGALPGGIGWYRKTFTVPLSSQSKKVYIDFDGVYHHSDVWINGHHLGFRPNGYISFRYDLTPYLNFGGVNVVAVKVDNSQQPNSRWYSGSGIYRNVWLVTTSASAAIDHWGTYMTTPEVTDAAASVKIAVSVKHNLAKFKPYTVSTSIYDAANKLVSSGGTVPSNKQIIDSVTTFNSTLTVKNPHLWSVTSPYLYKVVNRVWINNVVVDEYTQKLGIRYFNFDADKGFSLNGKPMKILGVCDHHDLGSLGSAINTRALERQLEILKGMGVNGIRTSHNPPAPELLDLCDRMGFIVMDEAFDMWKAKKSKYDYHLYWDEWHKRDLEDQVKRDRNHPSVFIWSIGNEIVEQYSKTDTAGRTITRELAGIVRSLDTTRPITTANNDPTTTNQLISSGALDLIGYNYHNQDYAGFHERFPGKKFIATETTSALETRGYYDMPSDSVRRWPIAWDKPFTTGNPDNTVSAYDNVSAPWGSTHEETWKVMKKYPMLSGMFIWTGFDYLGEPTPYSWPSRSSYFGVIDLAGFPKDVYYLYKSEWTDKPVLHIFPHWNWTQGKTVDVWAYYNNADEVELYLNGKSIGVKKKTGDDLHVMWRLKFEPGTLKAISRRNGKVVLTKEIHTAGAPAKIELTADRKAIKADGRDLSFVTVRILDKAGNLVPNADNLVKFKIAGPGSMASVDNGDPVSHDPFKADWRKAFHGLALAIIQGKETAGTITLTATADGLAPATVVIKSK